MPSRGARALGYRLRMSGWNPLRRQAAPSTRWSTLDQVRGVAVLWMTAYHFAFDLNHFGWIRQNFLGDPVWTVQRTLIVSLFLGCAGFGQAIALSQGLGWSRFWRRWAQVAGCALLVTAGSWWMFPRSFIYFGVLHAVAVMLPLLRLLALRQPRAAVMVGLGALAVAAPWAAAWIHAQSPALAVLDERAWNWIGWIGRKPVTEDYVPLLPWIGVMLWGWALGRWWSARGASGTRPANAVPAALGGAAPRALAWIGRHSLSWYMLHQPVLIGLLMLAGRPSP